MDARGPEVMVTQQSDIARLSVIFLGRRSIVWIELWVMDMDGTVAKWWFLCLAWAGGMFH
mgnify:FL=1